MPFSFALISLGNTSDPDGIMQTGTAPAGEFNDGGLATIGSTWSGTISAAETLTIDQDTLEDDYNSGGNIGNTLSAPVKLDNVTYPAGSLVETDYSAVLQDPSTGYYFVISHVTIDGVAVGATISLPFDATVDGGDGAVVSGGSYLDGITLELVDPDDVVDSAGWDAFVQDTTYNQGACGGYSNDVDLSDTWSGSQDPSAVGIAQDGVVEGTDGAERIDTDFVTDPEGDRVDGADGVDDVIEASGGDDRMQGDEGPVLEGFGPWLYEYYDLDPTGDPRSLTAAGFTENDGRDHEAEPTETGFASTIAAADYDTGNDYALKFTTQISITEAGTYTFA